jgi:hypothetical protein
MNQSTAVVCPKGARFLMTLLLANALACSQSASSTPTGTGGHPSGGVKGTGGAAGAGGTVTGAGGKVTSSGGSQGTGGSAGGAGGSTTSFGGSTTGGRSGTGGILATGGSSAKGGAAGMTGGVGGGQSGAGGNNTLDAALTGGAGGSGGTGGAGGGGGSNVGIDASRSEAGSMNPSSCTGSGQTYYASPDGTGTDCSLASPCSLDTAAAKPKPGDIICMRGGTYASALSVPSSVSGTDSGWVTFAAYPGELPIINGGVKVFGSSTSHIRFDGIASQGGESGFENPLSPSAANGPLEFINCIADMNTMNGIGFHGTGGLHVAQCIVAHTGSSTTNSWSSGVDLWGSKGTSKDTIIERTIAFENVDMQKHTDGSGFIVDTNSTGATFVNNIGFRNGGSCFRVTSSTDTHMINNTCYANGLDPQATAPTNPGEFYASSNDSTAVIYNNIAVATGKGGDSQALANFNGSKNSNNVMNSNGTTNFWVDPAGTHPDFHLNSSATSMIGKGTSTEAPSVDIGFDPKCITKKAPTGSGVQSWWLYSIDYDYIKSLGGTAQCFHPKARSGTPDIGAYAN